LHKHNEIDNDLRIKFRQLIRDKQRQMIITKQTFESKQTNENKDNKQKIKEELKNALTNDNLDHFKNIVKTQRHVSDEPVPYAFFSIDKLEQKNKYKFVEHRETIELIQDDLFAQKLATNTPKMGLNIASSPKKNSN